MSIVLLGKPVQQEIQADVLDSIAVLGRQPRMATVGVSDNAEWCSYVASLAKSASSYNCIVDNYFVDSNHDAMAKLVSELDSDDGVDGIIMQQPLPRDYEYITDIISQHKDIDGVCADNKLAMLAGRVGMCPATPMAVIKMLEHYHVDIQGKKVAIIGRGVAVGKPLMLMLLNANATITVCHSKSVDIDAVCAVQDIIVSACGVPNIVDSSFVHDNTVVIDVGTNFVDGKLCGDVCYDSVAPCCGAISPVPGGVGPVTRACLFENLVRCALSRSK